MAAIHSFKLCSFARASGECLGGRGEGSDKQVFSGSSHSAVTRCSHGGGHWGASKAEWEVGGHTGEMAAHEAWQREYSLDHTTVGLEAGPRGVLCQGMARPSGGYAEAFKMLSVLRLLP